MDHPAFGSAEPSQALKVKVERVEQAGPRCRGYAVVLHPQPTPFKLTPQRTKELVSSPARWWAEFVKDGHIRRPDTSGSFSQYHSQLAPLTIQPTADLAALALSN
jgi:hypothetical protein